MKTGQKKNKKMILRNRFFKRTVTFLLGVAFCLCSCTKKASEADPNTVLTFNQQPISIGEVYVYVETIKEEYERKYGLGVWDMKISSDTDAIDMEELTRRDIIDNIVKVKTLTVQSKNLGISLSAEEQMDVNEQTSEFWKNLTDRQIESMGLTRDIVCKVITENLLAKKTYEKVIEDAKIEVSDEEARETSFYDMFFACYTLDSNNDVVAMTEENRAAEYKKAVQAYDTLITPVDDRGEKNVVALSEYYGLKYSSYYTMTPEEIEKKYGKDIKDVIYSLEDDSYSLVTESEYGYHIFYVNALTDREATDKRKAEITKDKEREYFENIYKNWLRSLDENYSYERSVNKKIYSEIEFR